MKKRFKNDNLKGYCSNCGYEIEENDNYCKSCGTKSDKVMKKPFQDNIQMVYGPPPVERFHKCQKCGYSWNNYKMIDTDKYCPACGDNESIKVKERN